MSRDIFFLNKTVECAHKAYEQNEVPVGAILVDGDGEVVASSWNQVEQQQNQVAHAEMAVLQAAAKKLGRWRLDDCTLYVSLEPCLMCLGALYLFRIKRLVYGAKSPLFGAVSESLDRKDIFGVYKNITLEVDFIFCAESQAILQKFFKEKRSEKNE